MQTLSIDSNSAQQKNYVKNDTFFPEGKKKLKICRAVLSNEHLCVCSVNYFLVIISFSVKSVVVISYLSDILDHPV